MLLTGRGIPDNRVVSRDSVDHLIKNPAQPLCLVEGRLELTQADPGAQLVEATVCQELETLARHMTGDVHHALE
jgi:hypothetical protein